MGWTEGLEKPSASVGRRTGKAGERLCIPSEVRRAAGDQWPCPGSAGMGGWWCHAMGAGGGDGCLEAEVARLGGRRGAAVLEGLFGALLLKCLEVGGKNNPLHIFKGKIKHYLSLTS